MRGGKRPGSGRPAEAGEPRRELCRVPLTSAELAELLDAAGDMPLAKWVRERALDAARR